MIIREQLKKELKDIPDNLLEEVYEYVRYLKYKISLKEEKIETHYASEMVLGKDWDRKEEDEAWQDL